MIMAREKIKKKLITLIIVVSFRFLFVMKIRLIFNLVLENPLENDFAFRYHFNE